MPVFPFPKKFFDTFCEPYISSFKSIPCANAKEKAYQKDMPFLLVGVTRLELMTSCPPDKRATNCAIPRMPIYFISTFIICQEKTGVNIRQLLKIMIQY